MPDQSKRAEVRKLWTEGVMPKLIANRTGIHRITIRAWCADLPRQPEHRGKRSKHSAIIHKDIYDAPEDVS